MCRATAWLAQALHSTAVQPCRCKFPQRSTFAVRAAVTSGRYRMPYGTKYSRASSRAHTGFRAYASVIILVAERLRCVGGIVQQDRLLSWCAELLPDARRYSNSELVGKLPSARSRHTQASLQPHLHTPPADLRAERVCNYFSSYFKTPA